jgi:methionyl-tRNA formyltransferase
VRAIFLGTPAAAVPSLTALGGFSEVATVVTRPDRPRGRSGTPQPSEIKQAALELGLEIAQPATAAELAEVVASHAPFDVALVVAYGMLIRPMTLSVPKAGFVNVHFSVLPRWRGAAPVQRSILAGDDRTGVTLMQMDEGLDTGPTLATLSTALGPLETGSSLTSRLADLGARMVTAWLPAAAEGRLAAVPQDQASATHAPKLVSTERWIDLERGAVAVLAAVRGLTPWPGAWIRHDGGAVRIVAARRGSSNLPRGVLKVIDTTLELGTPAGSVELLEVQPEGKRVMGAMDWARGLRDGPGRVS